MQSFSRDDAKRLLLNLRKKYPEFSIGQDIMEGENEGEKRKKSLWRGRFYTNVSRASHFMKLLAAGSSRGYLVTGIIKGLCTQAFLKIWRWTSLEMGVKVESAGQKRDWNLIHFATHWLLDQTQKFPADLSINFYNPLFKDQESFLPENMFVQRFKKNCLSRGLKFEIGSIVRKVLLEGMSVILELNGLDMYHLGR